MVGIIAPDGMLKGWNRKTRLSTTPKSNDAPSTHAITIRTVCTRLSRRLACIVVLIAGSFDRLFKLLEHAAEPMATCRSVLLTVALNPDAVRSATSREAETDLASR